MTNITQEDIRTLPLPLPPLPEQRRIADVLDKADAIRRKRKDAIALSEELLRSAFLEVFGDPVTNPKGWEVKALAKLLSMPLRNGLSPASGGGHTASVLTLSAVTRGRFDGTAVKQGAFAIEPSDDVRLDERDLLICRGNGNLGTPASVLSLASHSSTGAVRFTLSLTASALVALETARDGGQLELVMTLTAYPFVITQYQGYAPGVGIQPTFDTYAFKAPKEQWLAVLKSVGYCDTLLTEVPLPTSGPEATAQGRQRLVQAVQARNDGGYAEAMRRCRIALDELKIAGFAGKAPADVARFLQDKAGTMSQAERFSALRLALQLYLSPTHHANAPDEHYTREDAELAIAMTAALLRLAPHWGTEPKEGD